jgi:hypothetical protein
MAKNTTMVSVLGLRVSWGRESVACPRESGANVLVAMVRNPVCKGIAPMFITKCYQDATQVNESGFSDDWWGARPMELPQ